MPDLLDDIKKDALQRSVFNAPGEDDKILYIDHRKFKKAEKLDIIDRQLNFKQDTFLVFVDPQPMMNWSHPCYYLLYDAKDGSFISRFDAEFPYFLDKRPKSLEIFHKGRTAKIAEKKRRLRFPLDLKKLSAWRTLSPFPLKFRVKGRRFAILFSGNSNCRHVNDMEFLYRTLVDVYGFEENDIYVCNRDGTRSWNPAGSWEPDVTDNYPVDGTPFRMPVHETGDRTGFQNVIADIASRMRSVDCLFIHTNNHGGWNATQNDAFWSCPTGHYYASDFASDLAALPKFNILLAMLEPCHSGGFNQPILDASPAKKTVVQSAVPWDENSAGGWFFDPWAEMWISAMAGVRGDGSVLPVSPDDDLNTKISAWEAYDYAINIDNPQMVESSNNLSESIYLCTCFTDLKLIKEFKEPKEIKEKKEFKEPKEIKEKKEFKEPKEFKEKKEFKEPKEILEKEPKEKYESKYTIEHEGFEITPEDTITPRLRRLESSIKRMEDAMKKIEPFITDDKRPDLTHKEKDGEE